MVYIPANYSTMLALESDIPIESYVLQRSLGYVAFLIYSNASPRNISKNSLAGGTQSYLPTIPNMVQYPLVAHSLAKRQH